VGAAAGTLQAALAAVCVRNVCSSVDNVINWLCSRFGDVLYPLSVSGAYVVIRRVVHYIDVRVRGGLTAADHSSGMPSLEHSSAS
jgi:hypothetical protein